MKTWSKSITSQTTVARWSVPSNVVNPFRSIFDHEVPSKRTRINNIQYPHTTLHSGTDAHMTLVTPQLPKAKHRVEETEEIFV